MKIAVESFWLNTKELTGVGYYLYHVLCEINKINPDNIYYLLYTGEKWIGYDFGENFIPVCYGKGKAIPAIFFNLHKVIKRLKPDLYHAPFPTRVPPQKLPCPIITTVHDLLALHIENTYSRILFNLTTFWAWKNSNHFLCNSHYTANEINRLKGIPYEKTTVTYPASAHNIPLWSPPGKHLLFVGSINHRKNPLFLTQVYHKLCELINYPPELVFVGTSFGYEKKFEPEVERCPANGKIIWMKYVPQGLLEELYSKAIALVLPSRLEGFGMPVIEAMSAGIPVICSDIEVFKEVAEGCALKISGWDINDWAMRIKNFLENENYRNELSAEGFKRSSSFSWRNCASLTYDAYNMVMGSKL